MCDWCIALQDGKSSAPTVQAGEDSTDTIVPNSGKIPKTAPAVASGTSSMSGMRITLWWDLSQVYLNLKSEKPLGYNTFIYNSFVFDT